MNWDQRSVGHNCDILQGYPAEMKDAEEFAMLHKRAMEGLEARQREIEAEILYDVSAELDDEGKPRFSNETKRGVEAHRRVGQYEGYANRAREISGHRVQMQEGWVRKHTLKEEMHNLRVIVQAQIANINVEIFGDVKTKEMWNGSE